MIETKSFKGTSLVLSEVQLKLPLEIQQRVSPGIRFYQPIALLENTGSCCLGLPLEPIKASRMNIWA